MRRYLNTLWEEEGRKRKEKKNIGTVPFFNFEGIDRKFPLFEIQKIAALFFGSWWLLFLHQKIAGPNIDIILSYMVYQWIYGAVYIFVPKKGACFAKTKRSLSFLS